MNKTHIFTTKANIIHQNKYDYSNVIYTNANTNVLIICPIHGEFKQRPDVHVNRKGNCPKCGYEQRATSRRANNDWWGYQKAKKYVNNLQLSSIAEWNKYCKSRKRPKQLSSCPKVTYKDMWEGWTAWIGKNNRTKDFLLFSVARDITRQHNLRSCEDWLHFCRMGKRPPNIPFNPKTIYSNDWVSWGDWLGFKSRANGNLSGIIYIIQQDDLPDNVYKIGRTYRLNKRLYEHQRVNNSTITVVCTFDVDNMKLYENKIHNLALRVGKQFKYNRSREHFEIDDIQQLIKLFSP